MEENNKKLSLSASLDKKFELVGKHVGKYAWKGHEIDFSSCTLREAERMYKLGFPGLKKLGEDKETAPAEKTTGPKKP